MTKQEVANPQKLEGKQEHLTERQPMVECGHCEGNKSTSPKKMDNVFQSDQNQSKEYKKFTHNIECRN